MFAVIVLAIAALLLPIQLSAQHLPKHPEPLRFEVVFERGIRDAPRIESQSSQAAPTATVAGSASLGLLGGAAAGGLLGYVYQGSSPGDVNRIVGGLWGGIVGATAGAPIGAHLGNKRAGRFPLTALAAVGATAAVIGLGTPALSSPAIPLLVTPFVLVLATTWVEIRTSR